MRGEKYSMYLAVVANFPLSLTVKEFLKSNSVEEIHSVGTINNVETSYSTQLKICYLMTTFRCPSDILY